MERNLWFEFWFLAYPIHFQIGFVYFTINEWVVDVNLFKYFFIFKLIQYKKAMMEIVITKKNYYDFH